MKIRRSSGCVPFFLDKEAKKVLVVVVKSSASGRWVFPKGGVEDGLSAKDNALKETAEEAGAVGTIVFKAGKRSYVKDGVLQKVTYYGLRVATLLSSYPEDAIRERRVVSLAELKTVVSADLQHLVHRLDFLQEELRS